MICSGCMVIAFSLLGLFGSKNSILDLFSHFRLQYGLYLLFISPLILKRKRLFLAFCTVAACNLILVALLYIPSHENEATLSGAWHKLTLLDMNINFQNENPTKINKEIESVSPDVVVIEELTAPLFQAMQPALAAYPYRVFTLRADPFGIGIFSKQRFLSSDANPLKLPVPFAISAVIQPGDKPVEIIAVHLLPPLRLAYADINKGMADQIGEAAHDFAGSVLIVGDLNATPWSALFTRLVKASGLRDSETGFGLQRTWPCGDPLLQIPIDHCLLSSDCKVADRTVGDDIASDHKPVLFKLLVP